MLKKIIKLAFCILCCLIFIIIFLLMFFKKEKDIPTISPANISNLTVYTCHTSDIYLPIIQEFEERTGIWVKIITGGTQELLNGIEVEATPYADVIFGGGVETLHAYSDNFIPYKSSEIEFITNDSFKDKNNLWTGFSALPLVIIYNTKLVDERTAPYTWYNLIDPKWAGKIAFASPEISGSCFTAFTTMLQLYDEYFIEKFVINLNNNTLLSSKEITSKVSDGTYSVGITIESNAIAAIEQGENIAYIYPEDFTSVVPDGIAICKNAENIENAQLFIDFVLSKDVQNFVSKELDRRSVRDDVFSNDAMQKLSSISQINYDINWVSSNRLSLLYLWQTLSNNGKPEE